MRGPLGHVKPATRNRLNVLNTREQKPASNNATTVHDRKQNRKRGPYTVIHARDQRKVITGTAYSIGARWTKMCKTIIFTRLGSIRAPKFRGKCKYTQRAQYESSEQHEKYLNLPPQPIDEGLEERGRVILITYRLIKARRDKTEQGNPEQEKPHKQTNTAGRENPLFRALIGRRAKHRYAKHILSRKTSQAVHRTWRKKIPDLLNH